LFDDEVFNRALTRFIDAGALAAHEAALKDRLINQVHAWSLVDFLADRAAGRSKAGSVRIQGAQNMTQTVE
jgi:hypothetical protein